MKVVHLCLGAFYIDHYSYQENMLPKFHKELGYAVEVIASTQSFDEEGRPCYLQSTGTYQNEYDIKVTRLPYKNRSKTWKKLKRYIGTYNALENAAPDILFIHNCQFLDIDQIVRYLQQHPSVTVYVDNHADFSNSATNWLSKNILHKVIWRSCAHQIEPYTRKFYGVLPARVDFLTDVYGLPKEKCELLVMGANDELVEKAKNSGARERIRERYGITDNDFLVVTGGKINQYRPETLHLMQAVTTINRENIKLLVFGVVSKNLKVDFNKLCEDRHIAYAGWLQTAETYDCFAAADLVVFPGLHSVMWEQAVAQGKVCIFRDIEGFHHVDIGGNAEFVRNGSVDGLKKILLEIIDDPSKYQRMKSIAEDKGMAAFSYKEIAKRSIL